MQQPTGRCMELVLLKRTKAADPQIFGMNLHFDGTKQRMFHFTGLTPQCSICFLQKKKKLRKDMLGHFSDGEYYQTEKMQDQIESSARIPFGTFEQILT